MISPFLFNVYLDEVLKSNDLLKDAIEKGNLFAFADDLMVIGDSKEHTK